MEYVVWYGLVFIGGFFGTVLIFIAGIFCLFKCAGVDINEQMNSKEQSRRDEKYQEYFSTTKKDGHGLSRDVPNKTDNDNISINISLGDKKKDFQFDKANRNGKYGGLRRHKSSSDSSDWDFNFHDKQKRNKSEERLRKDDKDNSGSKFSVSASWNNLFK